MTCQLAIPLDIVVLADIEDAKLPLEPRDTISAHLLATLECIITINKDNNNRQRNALSILVGKHLAYFIHSSTNDSVSIYNICVLPALI